MNILKQTIHQFFCSKFLTESLGSIRGMKTPSLTRSVQAGGKVTNSNFLKAKLPKSNLIFF